MNQTNSAWQRLSAAARRFPDEREVTAPYGFSTRIAALAMAAEHPVHSVLERLSLRAMGVACLLALGVVSANYSSVARLFQDEAPVVNDDPVAALVDIAS